MRDVHQDAAWCALGDYSFVQEAEERGWLKLHAQMGDALRNRMARKPDDLRRTHSDWQAHWQSRSSQETDEFAALAWYHLYQLDPEKARRIWNERVEHARQTVQMGVHFALLEWWTPTGIETHISVGRNDAAALNILGVELVEATFRNRAANLARAIACYEHALSIYTPEAAPFEYAMTQNRLGNAYAKLPVGDRAANLQKAIACYEQALGIYTPEAAPREYAAIQNRLGNAYAKLPVGDRAANLQKAISCYEHALSIFTPEAAPREYAMTQMNLGVAYAELPAGDRAANLEKAISGSLLGTDKIVR